MERWFVPRTREFLFSFNLTRCLLKPESTDVTGWKFKIMIIVTKIITVISIITVLLKWAGNAYFSIFFNANIMAFD